MSNPNPTAGSSAPTPGILPPNIFDPKMNGADAYWYSVDTGALAPAAVANPQIQIDAGTDFYAIALSYQAQANGAGGLEESTNPIPLVTLQWNDSGSTRNLLNIGVPIGAIMGDGKRPYRLIRPRLFRANSNLSFTLTSFEPAVTYAHLYLVLHGYRKFAST